MKRRKTNKQNDDAEHAGKTDRASQHKMIWLYGSYQPIINRAAAAFINNENPNFDFYRITLEIGIDELFIPIWWNVRNRAATIEKLIQKDFGHLLILGLMNDKEDEEIHQLYKYGEAVFIMPEEISYHEASAGTDSPPAWHEVRKSRQQWHKFLNTYFNENWKEL